MSKYTVTVVEPSIPATFTREIEATTYRVDPVFVEFLKGGEGRRSVVASFQSNYVLSVVKEDNENGNTSKRN